MFFEHVYDPDLAQGSYIVGCQRSGEAVVVDPRRDAHTYLDAAAAAGLRITDVTETHVHADYLSGARELAECADARLWLGDEGGPDWRYRFGDRRLVDGDEIRIGAVVLRALHTPGHTPEHLSFLVIDRGTSDEPRMLLSGDFVFVGDLGRPDLLDRVAGGVDTRYEGARQLFASLRDVFATLPDHVQLWPGHGAGSACGKALGAVAASTVGYERRTAWWAEAVASGDEDGFTRALLEGQPDVPDYFARMKVTNRDGPPLLGERGPVPRLDAADVARRVAADEVLLIDTRGQDAWRRDAPTGAVNVPLGRKFATYAPWAIDPELDRQELVLLAPDAATAAVLRDKAAWTGIDRVVGFIDDLAPFPREPVATVSPDELAGMRGATILDVRSASEWEAGHIDGARRLHAGRLRARLDEVPRDGVLVTHCESGARSAVAASVLRAHGFDNVVELEGSYRAWREARAGSA